jgi:hypothetical protein
MDGIVAVASWIMLAGGAIKTLCGPFLIGEAKGDAVHTPGEYLVGLVGTALQVVLVGRCLGWW